MAWHTISALSYSFSEHVLGAYCMPGSAEIITLVFKHLLSGSYVQAFIIEH